jgi:hypothetical protein
VYVKTSDKLIYYCNGTTWTAVGAAGLTIGTTTVTSGTDLALMKQASGVLQSSDLLNCGSNRFGIGGCTAASAGFSKTGAVLNAVLADNSNFASINTASVGTVNSYYFNGLTGPRLYNAGAASSPFWLLNFAGTTFLPLAAGNVSLGASSQSSGISQASAGVVQADAGDGTTAADFAASKSVLTAGTATVVANSLMRRSVTRLDWTNAMIVALGGVTAGDITMVTLPAKTVVYNAYVVINTPDTSTNALTVACGRTGATYVDYIGAGDAKAAANTVYGDSSGERGTNLTGYDLPSFTATTAVNCHFIKTTTNLSTVTGSTGSLYLETAILP